MKRRWRGVEEQLRFCLSMTGFITGGSEALKGNEGALNDDGRALKGIGAMKRRQE